MPNIRTLLSHLRSSARTERDKGTYFECVALAFLKNDPGMVQEYEDAWTFRDWAVQHGLSAADTGVDLVARVRDGGGLCAIQCKFYRDEYVIQKGDIDSFFTASGKSAFSRRLIIDTTVAPWGKNARESLEDQQIETTRIGLDRFEESPIDWATYIRDETVALLPKKEPRPHQLDAIRCTREGFETHDRGKLIMACGTGKTFTGLKIAESLAGPGKHVLFLVPSLSLMSQSVREWTIDSLTPLRSFAVCSDGQVGRRRKDSDDIAEIDVHDLDYPATTNAAKLAQKVMTAAPDRMTVVFATYQSIQVLADAQALHGLPEFDLIICDEAHRTTGATFPGEDQSNFVKVHDRAFLAGSRRLYMTATPRVFGETVKAKASEASVELSSMDNEALFGPTFFTRGFGWAVENELLTDYKVIVLAVDEGMVSASIQARLSDAQNELKLDDATKIVGCYKALTKAGLREDVAADPAPMHKALAFCRDIASSKLICEEFSAVVRDYLASDEGKVVEDGRSPLSCELRHVDGTFGAKARTERLDWLKAETSDDVCRILSNARCLSEGVDVPALDAILFLHPRKSQIDVVQSVGRVMRRASGKSMGYVILPIGVPAGMSPEEALSDNDRYRVVWQILNALRSHDERFDATINKMDLGVDVTDQIEVIAVSNKLPSRSKPAGASGIGEAAAAGEDDHVRDVALPGGDEQLAFVFDEFARAIMAKIVKKVGRRDYWETWASDIAEIAKKHVTRIDAVVNKVGSPEQVAFQRFLAEIRDDLNDSITAAEAVEMLAQHIITRPVFEALFQDHSFAANNPVSVAMQSVLAVLQAQNLEKEAESLQRFYDSVRRRAAGVDSAEAKQRIVIELYDKFFRTAFPRMTEKLGIVYTPVEIVDFILRSVDERLRTEFDLTLGSAGVHIIDPFTGTGTFITRLLQLGLIEPDELARKFREELHANEIVLLAYYIAAINIEAVYSNLSGRYEPFRGICLTDTFQLYEQDRDLLNDLLVDNSNRRTRQKALDVRVVVGNPPYSAQQGSENENNKNLQYRTLDKRIGETYVKASKSKLAKANYDSYVRALRWASDRVNDRGVIAFVTNGSFIDAKNLDGVRKALVEEFSSVSIFDLRGDQRTAGEASRREGGKVFGSGSRTPVAITVLVKNPDKPSDGAINYFDIGDYLSREDKLAAIAKARSSAGITWDRITPNAEGDWINQRDPAFQDFIPMAERDGKAGQSVFLSNSFGVVTNRDPWVYASTPRLVEQRVRKLITAFNEEISNYRAACEGLPKDQRPEIEAVVSSDPRRISWTRALKKDAESGKRIDFDAANIVPAAHRPFVRQFLYFDRRLNEMVNLTKKMFPDVEHDNLVISCTGVTDRKGFSCLVTDRPPNMHLTDTSMCYPRYVYERPDLKTKDLFAQRDGAVVCRDGVSDWALGRMQDHYGNPSITKDDVFWYTYGILHSPEYRTRFQADLQKVHPRLPFAGDFRAFSEAGRKLGHLHLHFDEVEPYPITIAQGDLGLTSIPDPNTFFRVEQMRFAGKRGGVDRTTIQYNSEITVTGIPLEAYDYVVNGKSAIEWVMERQGISTDKPSGIVDDANLYAVEVLGDPSYPLKLLQRVIRVSVETVEIVKALPPLEETQPLLAGRTPVFK